MPCYSLENARSSYSSVITTAPSASSRSSGRLDAVVTGHGRRSSRSSGRLDAIEPRCRACTSSRSSGRLDAVVTSRGLSRSSGRLDAIEPRCRARTSRSSGRLDAVVTPNSNWRGSAVPRVEIFRAPRCRCDIPPRKVNHSGGLRSRLRALVFGSRARFVSVVRQPIGSPSPPRFRCHFRRCEHRQGR